MKSKIKTLILILAILCLDDYSAQAGKDKKGLSLMPDYTVFQYAGSIGLGSAGIGYRLGKKDRLGLEFLYSYTPVYDAGDDISAFSFKALHEIRKAFSLTKRGNIQWLPFRLGIGLTYKADDQFFGKFTDTPYPDGYYWHYTGMRSMLLLQSEIKILTQKKGVKDMSVYLEANFQDLYITMYAKDRNFTFSDMMMLGAGVKVVFGQ